MIDKDIAEFAVETALKNGCSYAEARIEESDANGLMLKNSIPQISAFDTRVGLGLRFLVNKSMGFLSTNKIEKGHIKKKILNSIKTTKSSGNRADRIELSEEKKNIKKYSVPQKIKLKDFQLNDKLEALKEIDKSLPAKMVPGRYLSLSDEFTKKFITTSEGTEVYSEIPRINVMYYLTVHENNKTSQRYWQYGASSGYEILKEWNLAKVISDEAKSLIKVLKDGRKIKQGKYDIVTGPEVTGIIVHESAGHPLEADRILGREAAQAGESFVTKEMVGTMIGNSAVNIVDEPAVPNSNGYYLYDDEGVCARRKFLIKDGRINELLHNRETAAALGLSSNGSSRATTSERETIVRMSNTFMLPGEHKFEELIEDVKKGIYLKNFMEWNIDDKRYNQKYVGSESYLIENGQITKPVINPSLEITTPGLYMNVDGVGKNLVHHAGTCGKAEPMQAIPVTLGGPSMRIRGIMLK